MRDHIVRAVVHLGRKARFESCSAMNARIPGHKLFDTSEDPTERGCACRVVKEYIRPLLPTQNRNAGLDPDDIAPKVGRRQRTRLGGTLFHVRSSNVTRLHVIPWDEMYGALLSNIL